MERLSTRLFYKIATQVERGANAQVWLAYNAVTSSDDTKEIIHGGQHYDEFRNPIPVANFADDERAAKRLWELSEEMAGIKFDISAFPAAR